jgi:hypothetical protein
LVSIAAHKAPDLEEATGVYFSFLTCFAIPHKVKTMVLTSLLAFAKTHKDSTPSLTQPSNHFSKQRWPPLSKSSRKALPPVPSPP